MRLISYKTENCAEAVGILSVDGKGIAPLSALGYPWKSMNEMIAKATDAELDTLEAIAASGDCWSLPSEQAVLLAPIPEPRQDILCLGLNYTEHVEEAGAYNSDSFVNREKRYPVYFSKRVNYCPGDGEGIPAYEDLTDSLDYEAELAVIIGKDCRNVSPDRVQEVIFGYTICNDISARDLQSRHTQWYLGKSLDGFAPLGPVIVTARDIAFPPKMAIKSYVNGELRQNSTTDMLIFGIDRIISELSQGMTLKAGTIISTGTPAGVGLGMTPPTFLKKGDTVTCEIGGIGALTTPII